MEKLLQEYVLSIIFTRSIEREELLGIKYSDYCHKLKNKELRDMLIEFNMNSREHVNMLKDKMIKLNIQG